MPQDWRTRRAAKGSGRPSSPDDSRRRRLFPQATGTTSMTSAPYADTLRRLHPPAPGHPAPVRATAAAVGRFLLGSPVFTRHVVLDRWFLRA